MNIRSFVLPLATATLFIATGCAAKQSAEVPASTDNKPDILSMRKVYTDEEIQKNGWEKATFAGGCFWCTEAIFEEVKGVKSVVSGYSGGTMENPTYKAVCTDTTGHAECVQIVFGPKECNYETLLNVHFKTHDPTTLNAQGNDVGIQYRSVVFYDNEAQMKAAQAFIEKLSASEYYKDPIVTQVVPLTKFWPAEDYHQDYLAKNPDQPYCIAVVSRKVDKFEHLFPELVKDEYK